MGGRHSERGTGEREQQWNSTTNQSQHLDQRETASSEQDKHFITAENINK